MLKYEKKQGHVFKKTLEIVKVGGNEEAHISNFKHQKRKKKKKKVMGSPLSTHEDIA